MEEFSLSLEAYTKSVVAVSSKYSFLLSHRSIATSRNNMAITATVPPCVRNVKIAVRKFSMVLLKKCINSVYTIYDSRNLVDSAYYLLYTI